MNEAIYLLCSKLRDVGSPEAAFTLMNAIMYLLAGKIAYPGCGASYL